MVSNAVLSNEIYFTQPNYQHHCRSNENTPSDPSDQESDNENHDNEIQVSSYNKLIGDD